MQTARNLRELRFLTSAHGTVDWGEQAAERSNHSSNPRGAEQSLHHDDDAAAAWVGSAAKWAECGHAPEVGIPVISDCGLVAVRLQ
jgi:hypothetical protein